MKRIIFFIFILSICSSAFGQIRFEEANFPFYENSIHAISGMLTLSGKAEILDYSKQRDSVFIYRSDDYDNPISFPIEECEWGTFIVLSDYLFHSDKRFSCDITQTFFNEDEHYEYVVNTGNGFVVKNDIGEIVGTFTPSNKIRISQFIVWNEKRFLALGEYAESGEYRDLILEVNRENSNKIEPVSPKREAMLKRIFSIDGSKQDSASSGFFIEESNGETKKVFRK